ncbi:MAG: hypothetical protein LBQ75_01365 [Zoogloeaceae bacterium]|nr:hypothetical protein [Zoogloeaceae bacterium]
MTDLSAEKMHAEIVKMLDEAYKARAEGDKIKKEERWYPFVVSVSLIGAGAALFAAATAFAKIFLP